MAAGPQGDDETCRHLCRSRAGGGLATPTWTEGRAMRRAGDMPINPSAHFISDNPREARWLPGIQDARVGNVRKRSPSLDFTRTRTDFLPPDLAASMASTTSAGRLTDLPATSRITSPCFRPF